MRIGTVCVVGSGCVAAVLIVVLAVILVVAVGQGLVAGAPSPTWGGDTSLGEGVHWEPLPPAIWIDKPDPCRDEVRVDTYAETSAAAYPDVCVGYGSATVWRPAEVHCATVANGWSMERWRLVGDGWGEVEWSALLKARVEGGVRKGRASGAGLVEAGIRVNDRAETATARAARGSSTDVVGFMSNGTAAVPVTHATGLGPILDATEKPVSDYQVCEFVTRVRRTKASVSVSAWSWWLRGQPSVYVHDTGEVQMLSWQLLAHEQ